MMGKTDAQKLAQGEDWQIRQLQLPNFSIVCEIGSRNCRIYTCVNEVQPIFGVELGLW